METIYGSLLKIAQWALIQVEETIMLQYCTVINLFLKLAGHHQKS
jgi:hypothetical protein